MGKYKDRWGFVVRQTNKFRLGRRWFGEGKGRKRGGWEREMGWFECKKVIFSWAEGVEKRTFEGIFVVKVTPPVSILTK